MQEEDLPDFAHRLGEKGGQLSCGGRARTWWWNKITKLTAHHTTGKHISDIEQVVRGAHGPHTVVGIECPNYGKEVGYLTYGQMIKMLRDPVLAKAFLGFSYFDMAPAAKQEFPRRVAGLFMSLARVRSLEKWPKYAAGKGLGVLPRNTTFLDKIAEYHEQHPDFRGALKPNSFCTIDGFRRTVCGEEWDKEWRDALATWRLEAELTRNASIQEIAAAEHTPSPKPTVVPPTPNIAPAAAPAVAPPPVELPPPIVLGQPIQTPPVQHKAPVLQELHPEVRKRKAEDATRTEPNTKIQKAVRGIEFASILKTEMLITRSLAKQMCDSGNTDCFLGKERKWINKTVCGSRGSYTIFAKLRGNLKDVDPYITPPVGKLLRSGKDVEKHIAEFCP